MQIIYKILMWEVLPPTALKMSHLCIRVTYENLPQKSTIFSVFHIKALTLYILCVSRKSLIEQHQNTPYSRDITNNGSTGLLY